MEQQTLFDVSKIPDSLQIPVEIMEEIIRADGTADNLNYDRLGWRRLGRGAHRAGFEFSAQRSCILKLVHYNQEYNKNEARNWEFLISQGLEEFIPKHKVIETTTPRGSEICVLVVERIDFCTNVSKLTADIASKMKFARKRFSELGITDMHDANLGWTEDGRVILRDAGFEREQPRPRPLCHHGSLNGWMQCHKECAMPTQFADNNSDKVRLGGKPVEEGCLCDKVQTFKPNDHKHEHHKSYGACPNEPDYDRQDIAYACRGHEHHSPVTESPSYSPEESSY